jgi:hypothetical protein
MSLLLLAFPAHAIIYGGNPGVVIHADRPQHDLVGGAVKLGKVRMHYCAGGGADYPVGEWIDPVEGWVVPIAPGDYCGVTTFWDSALTLDVNGQDGSFGVAYTQSFTDTPLPTQPVVLTPISVVYGIIYGGNPGLVVTIEQLP